MYDRRKAVEYANEWAFSRNPEFYTFDDLGETAPTLFHSVFMQGAEL